MHHTLFNLNSIWMHKVACRQARGVGIQPECGWRVGWNVATRANPFSRKLDFRDRRPRWGWIIPPPNAAERHIRDGQKGDQIRIVGASPDTSGRSIARPPPPNAEGIKVCPSVRVGNPRVSSILSNNEYVSSVAVNRAVPDIPMIHSSRLGSQPLYSGKRRHHWHEVPIKTSDDLQRTADGKEISSTISALIQFYPARSR